jgi:wyosine [tRNA(Phe)-imidazoG37] synthetase (radical SAM superfamily)
MGEPTLAQNLGRATELARSRLKLPVAILTDSSLIPREDVRDELSLADVVVAKLDAPDEVELNTPLRPSPKRPLTPPEMEQIETEFWGMKVVNVYKSQTPRVMPLNSTETLRRRPKI